MLPLSRDAFYYHAEFVPVWAWAKGDLEGAQDELRASAARLVQASRGGAREAYALVRVYLSMGALAEVRRTLPRVGSAHFRRVVAVECLLVEGKTEEAFRSIDPDDREFTETGTQRAHIKALRGDPKGARELLKSTPPGLERLTGLTWRSVDGTRAVLDGAWWPGVR